MSRRSRLFHRLYERDFSPRSALGALDQNDGREHDHDSQYLDGLHQLAEGDGCNQDGEDRLEAASHDGAGGLKVLQAREV